jgi:hypothetical protein
MCCTSRNEKDMMQTLTQVAGKSAWIAAAFAALIIPNAMAQSEPRPLPQGVEKFCSIIFDKDARRPARVEDSALACIEEAVKRLKQSPDKKLVLVGTADIAKDITAQKNGMERDKEDPTGLDVRWEDLAAYRVLNTKWYITRYYQIDPARILPTTEDYIDGQTVTFYLVPGTADFNHNFLGTTKTNEKPCTVKPCYSPDEETLTAQPRSRIPQLHHAAQ